MATKSGVDRGVELATIAQSWREAAERLEHANTIEHSAEAVSNAQYCREWARYFYARAAQYLEGAAYND